MNAKTRANPADTDPIYIMLRRVDYFILKMKEAAAERDRLKEINAELLEACKFALDVATMQAKNPKTTSGTIQTLKDHLEVAIKKVEGREKTK